MSGPKSYGVAVVSAAELERRAMVSAIARLQAAARTAALLRAEMLAANQAYAVALEVVDVPAFPTNSSRCDALAARLAAQCEAGQRQLDAVIAGARAAALIQAVDSVVSGPAEPAARAGGSPALERRQRAEAAALAVQAGPDAARLGAAARSETDVDWFGKLAIRVQACLELLEGVPDGPRRPVEESARALLGSTRRSEASGLLHALQYDVQKANQEAARLREIARQREQLQIRLSVLPAEYDRDEFVARLAQLPDNVAVPPALSDAVAAAESRCAAEQDRSFALDVTTQCLEQLGYEVQEGFETASADGKLGYLRRAGWPGYAVQVRAAKGTGQLRFNVVRSASAQASRTRDREIEQSWCSDLAVAREKAIEAGVDLRRISAEPPGEMPVQVVQDQKLRGFGTRREGTRRDTAQDALRSERRLP